MKKYLIPAALLLGILFEIFFWGKVPGVSFPIFIFLCLSAGYFLINAAGLHPAKNNYLLFIPIVFLALMAFVRKEPLTSFLNVTMTLFVMALLAMTYLSGKWTHFGLGDYFVNFFQWVAGILSIPWQISENKDPQEKNNGITHWINNAKPVIIGVLLALPVLLIFSAFFASADMVFASKVNQLFIGLRLENLPEYILRGFLIIAIAYVFTGVILYAARSSDVPLLQGEDKPVIKPFLGFIETSIILVSVVLLFSAFVLIQFKYLFLGQANITLQGFTYSEYARKGFGELVAVAFSSMLLIKGLSAISKLDSKNKNSAFTGLIIGLVFLVLIILGSAFQRLFLYESAYGFSRSRTYAHVFIMWLGVLLLAIVIMEIFHRQRLFANIALAILLGFIATLNLVKVDGFIVRNNINRTLQGEMLDVSYLSTLSTDAIPELAEHFLSTNLPQNIHEGLGAALSCFQKKNNDISSPNLNWQSFHLSKWIALQDLQKIQPELNAYEVIGKEQQMIMKSPGGSEYSCLINGALD